MAHECGPLGVVIQRLTVCDEKDRNVLFAYRTFGERNFLRSYYASPANANLEKKSQRTKRYGEKYMKIAE